MEKKKERVLMSFIHLFTQALHRHSHLLFIQSISVKIEKSSSTASLWSRCFCMTPIVVI